MKKSKLIRYLSSLGQKEWTDFKDYCLSPYHNKDKEAIQLLAVLNDYYPWFPAAKVEKEKLAHACFKEKSNPAKQLSYAASNLSSLFESYITQKQLELTEFSNPVYLLQAFQRKGLDKDFENLFEKQSNPADETGLHPDNAYDSYKLFESADQHYLQSNRTQRYLFFGAEAIQNLDNYYIIQKIRGVCALLNRQNILAGKYDLVLPQQVLTPNFGHNNGLKKLHQLYLLIYQAYTYENHESYFEQLLVEFKNDHQYLHPDIKKEVSTYLLNYCTQQINKGKANYFNILFELYKLGLEHEIFLDEGLLRPSLFKNIVSVAIRLQQFDWAVQFMESYAEKLDKQHRQLAVDYNKATLFFEQKKYRDTLMILNTTTFSDPFYALGARSMLIRIFFETAEWDALQSQIASFSAFLHRNKSISAYQKTIHVNLLRFVRRLSTVIPSEKGAIYKLQSDIASTRQIAYLSWLNAMVDAKLK